MTLDEYIEKLLDLRNKGAAHGGDRVVRYRMGGGGIETAPDPTTWYTLKKKKRQTNTYLVYAEDQERDEPVVVI